MPQASYLAGIGALGSAKARFFHPRKKIREKYPQDDKHHLKGVVVMGEGQQKVNLRQQDCYLIRINDFDDGTIFHIVKKNLRIDQHAKIPFKSELQNHLPPSNHQVAAPIGAGTAIQDWESTTNKVQNFYGSLSREYRREEVKVLRQQGIIVNDNNNPIPKNNNTNEQCKPWGRTWEKPMTCPCQVKNLPNCWGKFTHHEWEDIAKYNELDLFRMCFPEKWVIDVLIPATNKELDSPINLQEFYVFLGCIFFQASFKGIPDCDQWWLTKAISMFEGMPHQLNNFMSRN